MSSARREEEGAEGSQMELRPNGEPAPCQKALRRRMSSLLDSELPVLLMGSGCEIARPTEMRSS